MRRILPLWLALVAIVPALAQDGPKPKEPLPGKPPAGIAPPEAPPAKVKLAIASEPGESSVFVRYGDKRNDRFLGKTPRAGGPLELEVEAGAAELVVVKDGFVCKVEPLDLRSGGAARLEVKLTPDITIPRQLVLKTVPAFVKDVEEGEELYVGILAHVVRSYVEEKDPRRLVDESVKTLADVLNAVRSREILLRRELPPEARKRYYGEELDLSGYPPLAFTKASADGSGAARWSLAGGGLAVEGTIDGDLDTHLAMLRSAWAFVKHRWDARRLLSDAVIAGCLIEGLIGGLEDEHTHFLGPDDVDEMQLETEGTFGGVGLVVGLRDGVLTVVTPMEGTPAARAGLRAGDLLLAIDGQPTDRMTLRKAVELMRGQIDSPVELMLGRGDKRITVTLVRAKVEVRYTAERLLTGAAGEAPVGYLRVTSFMREGLHGLVRDAIERLERQGAKALVIDVRNNPGGLLEEAALIADLFVPGDGVVVSTRDREGERRILKANPATKKVSLPIAVLINEGSASASEILAGVLRDHRLATLFGQKSFGKGSVQRVLPLDPYGCALALTVATYHLPSGATPHKVGVKPDVEVKLTEEQVNDLLSRTNYTVKDEHGDPQLDAALEHLRARVAGKR